MAPLDQASAGALSPALLRHDAPARTAPAVKLGLGGWPLLAVALLGGTALRLWHLEGMSLWGDEACMLALAQRPALEIVDVLAAPDRPDVDVAPPLYFVLLRGVLLFGGASVGVARLFSAILSVGTIAATYALGARYFDRPTGGVAALLVAGSAFHVWYAQEARMYAMVTLLGVLMTHAFLGFVKTGRGAVAFLVLALAGLYTQYYAYLLVAALMIGGTVALGRERAERWHRLTPLLWMALILAGGVLPWVPVVFKDLRHAGQEGFPANFSLVTSIPFVLAKFALFGNEAFVRDHLALYAAFAPLLLWGLCRGILALDRTMPEAPWILALAVFGPMGLVAAATAAGVPVYKSHPFILVAPLATVLLAHGLTRFRKARGLAALGLLLGANLFVMHRLNFGDVYTKPKVREAMEFVEAHREPGDILLKVPAKLHDAPVETGELLSWRYYAPPGLTLEELNGRDVDDLVRKLAAHTQGRSRFFLAIAETRFTRELGEALLRAASERWRLRERAGFPSRMRDFGLSVYLFEDPGGARGEAIR